MAVKYLSRVLGTLRGLYQFPGQVASPPSVDLARPLTLVHDVSREAELLRGFYYTRQIVWTTVTGNTVVYGGTDVPSILASARVSRPDSLNFLDDQPAVWLCDVSAILTATFQTNFGGLWISAKRAGPWADNTFIVPIVAFEAENTPYDDGTYLTTGYQALEYAPGSQSNKARLPMLLGSDGAIAIRAASDAGGDSRGTVQCSLWIGPKGTRPPNA